MWQRIWQISLFILIVSLAAIGQFSLIGAWPGIFAQINLGLLILIFSLFFFNLRSALLAGLVFGFWLDVMTFRFFGFYLIVLFLTLLAADWLLKNWLTNRSLYSFIALILLATGVYNLLAAILFDLFEAENALFFLGRGGFWLAWIYQSIWNLLVAIFFFNVAAGLTKRLKPFFLEKKGIV